MRDIELPSGQHAILSDTVGFVSNLPHELVEAFHATLEEVMEAELILHVRDASHVDTEAQKADVFEVLAEIGIEERAQITLVEVLNKIDLMDAEARQVTENRANRSNQATIAVSALGGDGIDELLDAISKRLSSGFEILNVDLRPSEGATLAWLYRNGDVIEREDDESTIHLKVRLAPAKTEQFQRRRKL